VSAKAGSDLALGLDLQLAEEVAEEAVAKLGWSLERAQDGRLIVHEDASKLHCHCSPLRAELTFITSGPSSTELAIRGQVPGWGLIASKHAREQTDLLTRRIGLVAIAIIRQRPIVEAWKRT